MTIGPVQLIVLGFPDPDFHGAVVAELERLSMSDTIAVVDALAVHKDADGGLEVAHLSTLSAAEAAEAGSVVGALVGLGIDGDQGDAAGDEGVAARGAADGISAFSADEEWDVIEQIPAGSAAALVLIEHRWAIPLRDAIAAAGGFRIADGFISPLDLIGIGLVSVEEAASLHELESAAVGAS